MPLIHKLNFHFAFNIIWISVHHLIKIGIEGSDPELVAVRGEANRDPRKHMITIVYTVTVDPDATYKAGDDAATADWYDLKTLMEEKTETDFAFDHHSILSEFISKKLPEY